MTRYEWELRRLYKLGINPMIFKREDTKLCKGDELAISVLSHIASGKLDDNKKIYICAFVKKRNVPFPLEVIIDNLIRYAYVTYGDVKVSSMSKKKKAELDSFIKENVNFVIRNEKTIYDVNLFDAVAKICKIYNNGVINIFSDDANLDKREELLNKLNKQFIESIAKVTERKEEELETSDKIHLITMEDINRAV